MKIMHCWRCGMDVPMLDEQEFAVIEALYFRALRSINDRAHDHPADGDFMLEQYRPVLETHHQMTGWDKPIDPHSILHHRIQMYGPPCSSCGKPLRTPRAKYCAACGSDRTDMG